MQRCPDPEEEGHADRLLCSGHKAAWSRREGRGGDVGRDIGKLGLSEGRRFDNTFRGAGFHSSLIATVCGSVVARELEDQLLPLCRSATVSSGLPVLFGSDSRDSL
ncbi:hypothetical protein AK812_SmicGene19311 [Symbiodinium microadriaticum]|uniref:Uncharacterized protein n=1 Tax=Symbiodinium microadriaticum TaxID=2951 RepID=A0A1Q9DSW8_SYMMI|nr:hypothetical protein AK812_SmicGene19311 [Symbiodinium microadriaticum]